MEKAGDRLKRAIEMRDYEDVADFARKLSMQPGTVRQHINRQSIPKGAAEKYRKRLKVPLGWLLYGDAPDPFGDAPVPAKNSRTRTSDVNDEVRNEGAESPSAGDARPEHSEREESVGGTNLLQVVCDLNRTIGRLEQRISNLEAQLEGADEQDRPQSGRKAR